MSQDPNLDAPLIWVVDLVLVLDFNLLLGVYQLDVSLDLLIWKI